MEAQWVFAIHLLSLTFSMILYETIFVFMTYIIIADLCLCFRYMCGGHIVIYGDILTTLHNITITRAKTQSDEEVFI